MAARESAEVKKAVTYVTQNGHSVYKAAKLAGVRASSVYQALARRGLHTIKPDPSKAPNKSRESEAQTPHDGAR